MQSIFISCPILHFGKALGYRLFENLKCEITPVSTKRFIKMLLLFLPIVVWNETIITLIGLKVGSPGITETKLFAMVNLYKLEHLSTWIVITILLAFCIELLKAPIGDKMRALLPRATR